MSNRAATVIEEVPNELWREIFEYFIASDLWFSFRGLNRRIDGIIDQTPLDLNLQRHAMYARFLENIHPTMNATNVANIRSLSMDASTGIKHFLCFHRTRSNRARTVIADIPVELWREIFEYFNASDLWFSFRGLNRRIDAILDRTPLLLHLTRRGKYARFVKNVQPTMNETHVPNIRSLSRDTSTEIKDFFSFYPLSSLVQLRSLCLKWFSSLNDPILQFWNQLSSLKHLQSLHIGYRNSFERSNCIEEKEFIIRSIFNQHFCPALQSFSIDTSETQKRKPAIPSLIPTTRVPHLRYVSIDSLTLDDLIKLLPAIQDIKSLRVTRQLSKDEKFSEIPPNVGLPQLRKCLQLELTLVREITFEDVEYLLRQTPNLKSLFLWGFSHLTDAKKWELLLSSHCPQLMKLELICMGFFWDDHFNDAMDYFRKECRVSSFWQQRGVKMSDGEDRSGHSPCTEFVVTFDCREK